MLPTGARSQQSLTLEAAVSHARPPSGLAVDPRSYLTAGLRWLKTGPLTLFAGGDGGWTLEGGEGDWISAHAGLAFGAALGGRARLGGTLVASGFEVHGEQPWRAALLRIDPTLSIPGGGAVWEIRLHGGAGRTRYGAEPDTRTEADLWLVGGGAGVRVPVGAATLEFGADAWEGEAGAYRAASGALERLVGDAPLRLEVSAWRTPLGETEVAGQLRVELPVGRAVRGIAAGGRSGPDPLLGSPPAGWASAAVSLDVLAAVRPVPRPVVEVLGGATRRARFRVRAPDAGTVELLGDFSRWEPREMRREGEDVWSVTLDVEPGVYHFGFRVDGEWWVPEDAPGRSEDEWGRPTATLVVS